MVVLVVRRRIQLNLRRQGCEHGIVIDLMQITHLFTAVPRMTARTECPSRIASLSRLTMIAPILSARPVAICGHAVCRQ